MIVGGDGELIRFSPLRHGLWASNLAGSTYRGQPVLTWWEGEVIAPGFGQGEVIIVDSAYRTVQRVHAGNRRQMDLHEFQLTPPGTALFTCYPQTVSMDLSPFGGPTATSWSRSSRRSTLRAAGFCWSGAVSTTSPCRTHTSRWGHPTTICTST